MPGFLKLWWNSKVILLTSAKRVISSPWLSDAIETTVTPAIFGKISMIPNGTLGLGDMGYRGIEDKVTHRNTFDDPTVKQFKRRALARQETGNSRLKSFKILEDRFRTMGPSKLTREERHKTIFEACAVILQYQLENGHPLFEV